MHSDTFHDSSVNEGTPANLLSVHLRLEFLSPEPVDHALQEWR